ncbi:MAG: RDD family protein [Acidobacteriota bacterium]
MNRVQRPRGRVAAAVFVWLAVVCCLPLDGGAQSQVPAPPAERTPDRPVQTPIDREAWGRDVVRIGQDYTLNAGDAIGQALVVSGTATIDGRVERDVVVIFGKVRLSSTAAIEGSLIVIGGSASAMSGAVVRRDLVVVGGEMDSPVGFMPGGQHIVVGSRALGARVEGVLPWLSRGLLWGRPIVPGLPWVWSVVGAVFFIYLVLNVIFSRSVGALAETLEARPLTTFAAGMLVLLLTGPVSLLLAVSVVGIAVIPFVLCALAAAWIIGKVGVLRWIGRSVLRHESPERPLRSIGSFGLGAAVISVAYMIPVLGLVTWVMAGIFGLGAAALTFVAGYRRERPPASARVQAAVRPPLPAPPVYHPLVPVDDQPAANQYDRTASQAAGAAASVSGQPESSAVPMAGADLAAFPRAAFRDRLAAFVLDLILVLIAYQVADDYARLEGGTFFFLLLVYHIGFWTWKGTTVGGIICQLRVVRVDGAPLAFADALVRGLSSIFSLAVAGLGCLWILKDRDRQAWHDRIAGTFVVKVPRNWPL